ncbi:E3 ubiquitin-protein ligase TRIM35 [Stigmatopora nigra]
MSLSEEDLTCPICCEIFTDPVVLSCSHSFCRKCQERCWKKGLLECPICRKKSSKSDCYPSLTLKNICQAVLQTRELEETLLCPKHGEKFKLFCLVEKEPICVVCQCSKDHKDHQCLPVEEAALDCQAKLNQSLKSLKDKLDKQKNTHKTSADIFQHIQEQATETRRLIRVHFEELRQMLSRDEEARLAAVEREEKEKMAAAKRKFEDVAAEALVLAESVAVIHQLLEKDGIIMLKEFKAHQHSNPELDSNNMWGVLMDVSGHLSNLKYRVWEKILENIDYTPVTLDPNTAHPCLILSDDLTSFRYNDQMKCYPDNPERFHMSAEVAGAGVLGPGRHRWVVGTRGNRDWLLGVASSSVPRDAEVNARPENGFWTLCFRDGQVKAMTSPPTPLQTRGVLERVVVEVDYERGEVAFWDGEEDAPLFVYRQDFEEKLLPYFYTQSSQPLTILPERVHLAVLNS